MTIGQTTYSPDNEVAVPGMRADNGPCDIVTMIAAEDIEAGRFVSIKSDGTVEKPKDDSEAIVGVALYGDMRMGSYPQGSPVIKAGDPFSVIRKGRVWVSYNATGTAAKLGTVHISNDNITPVTADFGKATGGAVVTNKVRDLASRAVYFKAAAATDTLALVELNLP